MQEYGSLDATRICLRDALKIVPTSPHTYSTNIQVGHCYGYVAHGGFIVSMLLTAIKEHFASTLSALAQPHTFDLHLTFLSPCTAGPGTVEITDTKIGKRISSVHVAFRQSGTNQVVGYASNMNMDAERGVSYPTFFTAYQKELLGPPAVDFEKLLSGSAPHWLSFTYPWSPNSYLRAATHIKWFAPVDGAEEPSIIRLWLTPNHPNDTFTTETLGSIADHWSPILENYRVDSPFTTKRLAGALKNADHSIGTDVHNTPFKYPTQSLSLDIKRALPPEGVQWLFLRAEAKQIENGRFDAEVLIFDADHRLVAMSHQVGYVVAGGFAKKVNKL